MRIRTVTGRSILRLRSWASGLAHIDPKVIIAGLDLPREVGAIGAGEVRALCTGPSDWLLVAPGSLSLPARGAIEADCVRQGLGLVDLSSGLSVLEVSSPVARDVLAKGCGLDLHPHQFSVSQCAPTRFAQLSVIVDCLEPTPRFELYVARSYSHYLEAWLLDAALDVSLL